MNASRTDRPHARPLRAAAEAKLLKTPSSGIASTADDHLLHELQVHQIELEMQNEDLRHAQIELEESRDRYVDLYEFAPVGYLTLTEEGLIAEINLAGTTLLGRARELLLRRRFTSCVLADDQDKWVRHFMGLMKQDGRGSLELTLVQGDGGVLHALLDCVHTRDPVKGSEMRIVLSDITQRKLAEDELRIAAVAFASQAGMMITDARGNILRVNPAFTGLTGYGAEEAIGQTSKLLRSGRQDQLFYQRMWSALTSNGSWQGEIWNKRKNGQIYAEMLSITAIVSPDRGITHYVASFTDITKNKEAEAEIHRLAYYDPLTRLPNRRLLQDRVGQALTATARSGHCGAVLFIDVDNFKALNDTRGHDIGDLLLVEVAQRMRSIVRQGDTVARQGGDEFVVLLEDLGQEPREGAVLAKQLGEKVREAIEQPCILNGYEYHCKISIGIGLFDQQETLENLFKHADLALYQAKNAGRNTLRFFDPAMQAALDLRSALETELRQALKLNQLLLHFQRQVDGERRLIGCEALLRWQHPQRGLVPPDDFIALAEDTGLILPIGHWVLETVCTLLASWQNLQSTRTLQVAVNVSARQFRQPDFVTEVRDVLAATGANPALLKLELTESLVLQDVEDAIEKMGAIKQLGVSLSMDDFGTGYSSLSYLTQLPIDQLKIDRSFVSNLPGKSKDETIAKAIITMGRGLAMHVIAEGVETEAQRAFLEVIGCDAYQGFLFSRPLPLDEFEALL